MEHGYYNAESLNHVVRWYEKRYGMTTEELLERHLAGERIEGLAAFDRHAWLSVARECTELRRNENVGERFRRELVVT
jgi:hypothetical protein